VDPPRWVAAVAAEAGRLGARVRTGVEVLGLGVQGGRVRALETTAGDVACAEVVVATGAWSPALGRALGARLPVQGGKGYFVEYEGGLELGRPTYFPERRLVLTPLGDRVRLTGMLELCGTDLRVDGARVAALRRQAAELVPALRERRVTGIWRGLRPCSPDGLPIVGRVDGLANASVATGHGMWGLQLAPVTAELLAGALLTVGTRRRCGRCVRRASHAEATSPIVELKGPARAGLPHPTPSAAAAGQAAVTASACPAPRGSAGSA
jgi:D-amino-acid dehydrogenase